MPQLIKPILNAYNDTWQTVQLKDIIIAPLSYGINAPAVAYSKKLPKYIRITDISDDGKYKPDPLVSVMCKDISTYLLNEDDILFTRTGNTTGKSYIYSKSDGKLVFAGFLIKATINKNIANPRFVFYYTQTHAYWDWIAENSMRSGQPGINSNQYSKMPLPCPPLPEQNAIVAILTYLDMLIDSLEQLILKKQGIMEGIIQELLFCKKRLENYSGEWIVKSLGELGELKKDSILPTTYPNNLYYEYSMPAFDLNKKPELVRGMDMQSNKTKIEGEILLFNKLNVHQKRVWYIQNASNSSVCSSEFLAYYSNKINLKYLSYVLSSNRTTTEFVSKSSGSSNSQKRITPSIFLNYMLFYPADINEQNAIVNILTNMDNEIVALEEKLAKYRKIKIGSLQQLMTGKIRLQHHNEHLSKTV